MLKIDKSFVNDITTYPSDKAIVAAIVVMAQQLVPFLPLLDLRLPPFNSILGSALTAPGLTWVTVPCRWLRAESR